MVANGARTVGDIRIQQFRCRPITGKAHAFSVTITDRRPPARYEPYPPCPRPLHASNKVVRAGPYGTGAARRQRYRCFSPDGTNHVFTPPLPRGHTADETEPCAHCEQRRGVHHGETAVARRHRWPTRVVVRALDRLGAGESYARVSRDSLRSIGIDPRIPRRVSPGKNQPSRVWDEEAGAFVDPPTPEGRRPQSLGALESRAAWHIAADWVEAFSPVLWAPVEERLRADAMAERARLDAAIEDRLARLARDPSDDPGPPERPQVLVVDDVPVLAREGQTKRRDGGFYVLVAGEVTWEQPARLRDGQADWEPRLSLRLARALPKTNSLAWRLVFDEIGYAPDFLVADGGKGIGAAHALHFDTGRTILVPSLWHIRQSVRRAMKSPGRGGTLAPEVAAHADRLSRTSGVLDNAEVWADWWKELEAITRASGLPLDKARNQRRNYQDAMAAVLPHLAVNPGLRLSIGGLEVKIRERIDRVLTLRSQFANVERTNLLFDLVVAREHGAFDHPEQVVRQLRADAEARRDERGIAGHVVSMRTIEDPRPARGAYSSLRDAGLLASLADERLGPARTDLLDDGTETAA